MKVDQQQSNLAEANLFYAGALRRIWILIAVFTVAGVLIASVATGPRWAAAFLAGGVLSALNFYLLKRSVNALGDRIVNQQSSERGGLIVGWFLIRYVLIALAAYVIFRGSVQGLYGFLVGLTLPIAASCCEAAYELYIALRRGL